MRLCAVLITLLDQGDKDGAQSHLENAVAALQDSDDKEDFSKASLRLADLLVQKRDSSGALKYYEQGLPALREKGDKAIVANALYNVANIKRSQKDPGARKDYQDALSIFRELNDTASASKVEMSLQDLQTDEKGLAVSMLNEALALLNQGSTAEAEKKFTEALDLAKDSESKDSQVSALLSLGYIKNREGKYNEAKSTYEEALTLSRETASKPNQALALYGLAVTAFNLQDTAQANQLWDQSAALYKELGQDPRPKTW